MPAIKLHPTRVLRRHKGYSIIDVRTQNAKGLITKTNITIFGKKKVVIKDKFPNVQAAVDYIDTKIKQ
jgi:hypothetical protein